MNQTLSQKVALVTSNASTSLGCYFTVLYAYLSLFSGYTIARFDFNNLLKFVYLFLSLEVDFLFRNMLLLNGEYLILIF